MDSVYNDPLLEFELHLQSSDSNAIQKKIEKQRKTISITKQKVLATDYLINKYLSNEKVLDETQKSLITSKEECKQVCIDYTNALEKCKKLEDDTQNLINANKGLEMKCLELENRLGAIQSHANQLQLLVKEHETIIEALKIENKLEKSSDKDYDKKITSLQKENDRLISHITTVSDVLVGRKKLTKECRLLLRKYSKFSNADTCSIIKSRRKKGQEIELVENNADEADIFGDCPMSPSTDDSLDNKDEKVTSSVSNNDAEAFINGEDIDDDSNSSNEIISVDTGQGSSLVSSDSEKCFNSPEYFTSDSLMGAEIVNKERKNHNIDVSLMSNQKVKKCDVATSPASVCNIVHTASSPIPFISTIDVATSPIRFHSTVHSATSPLRIINSVTRATSPIICETNHIQTDIQGRHNVIDRGVEVEDLEIELESNLDNNDVESLELNSCNNLYENDSDCEVETILDKMRMPYGFITPLPPTPEPRNAESRCNLNHVREENSSVVTKLQDNKALQATVAKHEQEIMNIKNVIIQFMSKKGMQENIENLLNVETTNTFSGVTTHINKKIPMSSIFDNNLSEYMCNESRISLQNKKLQPINEELFVNTVENTNLRTNTENENYSSKNITQNIPSSQSFGYNNSNESVNEDVIVHNNDATEQHSFVEVDIDNVSMTKNTLESATLEKSTPPQGLKRKKLNKLDRFKKKLMLKTKIKRADTPPKKVLTEIKTVTKLSPRKKKNIISVDSAASLNDKAVYDKALRVMTELKTKQNNKVQNNKEDSKDLAKNDFESSDKEKFNNLNESVSCNLVLSMPPQHFDKTCDRNRCNPDSTKIVEPSGITTSNVAEYNTRNAKVDNSDSQLNKSRKRLKNNSFDKSEMPSKKILRSSIPHDDVPVLSTLINSESSSMSNEHEIPAYNNENISDICIEKKTASAPNSITSPIQSNIETSNVNVPGSLSIPEQNFFQLETKHIDNKSCRKQVKSVDKYFTSQNRRILRSSFNEQDNINETKNKKTNAESIENDINSSNNMSKEKVANGNVDKILNYTDLDLFLDEKDSTSVIKSQDSATFNNDLNNNILCKMIDKYGKQSVKVFAKKVPDVMTNSIYEKIEESVTEISELPPDKAKAGMNNLVEEIRKCEPKLFLSGLMKYLKDPARKTELFNKIHSPLTPAMTKSEQILLYVITQLKINPPFLDIVEKVWNHIEYVLFKLNSTPEFDVIESISHFYAILCRYFRAKSRLRIFILDSMYCMQFKAIPLIRQCLDVWMHILPLAHMGIAKTPLVTCLVYLLHFFKCKDDKFNRVQDIRNILIKKYYYQMADWNETRIIEMFKNALEDLKEIPLEKKMLRMALIILAKRQGPLWCQNHIIKNMLQPIIKSDSKPDRIKRYCVSLLGPLMKPYPLNMKVHCEVIINQLLDIMDQKLSLQMEEAIIESLIFMNKHNQNRILQLLLSWNPPGISVELEELLRDFIQEKPLKVWKTILSKLPLN